MDIKAKLALLKKQVNKVRKKHTAKYKKKKVDLVLPGFIQEETGSGVSYFREKSYPLTHKHGDIFLWELLSTPGEIIAFMGQDDELKDMEIPRTLFLDTETTGLAGGTGTYPFLIGVGFIRDQCFVVRQYFMPDYSFESAMLCHLNQFMKDYTGLVTFNGKTYDMPLIKTRMSMNRLRLPSREPLHLDLLHGSRRLWKKTHGSCALTSLESAVLHFYRENDTPGFLIPEMYFQYLRNRKFPPMEGVFEHNLYDIISMAALIVKMWSHLEMARGGMVCGTDYFSLGDIYNRQRDEEQAIKYFEKAMKEELPSDVRRKIMRKLSNVYKRNKDYIGAIEIWEEMRRESSMDIFPYMELAKYYEHKAKDIQKALEYTRDAIEILERKRRSGMLASYYKEINQVTHRQKRLQKKLK